LLGLITRAGAFYSIAGEKFQGREALTNFLEGTGDLAKKLEHEINTKVKEIRIGKIDLPEEISINDAELSEEE